MFGIFGADISQRKTAAVARKGVAMGKILLPALLAVLISACAANAIELKSSSDPTDRPFGMAEFAAPEGVTKDKWRKIKADILAELPKLTKCQSNLDECTSTVRKFEEIVKEAERHDGLAKISFINALINALIDYEPDRNQWGVADQWTAPFVNKKGAFETGHGDCEDYALAKYVALRQAGVRSEDVRVALVMTMPSAPIMPFSSSGMTSAGSSSIIVGTNWSRIKNSLNSSRLPSSTPVA